MKNQWFQNLVHFSFRDETYRQDVIEKQGDLIRYLRERNAFLLQKIQQMTEINQTSGRA